MFDYNLYSNIDLMIFNDHFCFVIPVFSYILHSYTVTIFTLFSKKRQNNDEYIFYLNNMVFSRLICSTRCNLNDFNYI